MMMVPRSYLQSSSSPPSSTKYCIPEDRSLLERPSGSIPVQRTSHPPSMTPSILTPPAATSSKPVVIPTRSRGGPKRKKKGIEEEKDEMLRNNAQPHDPSSVAPSVAALLAMTAIPQRKQSLKPEAYRERRRAAYDEASRRTLSSSSPQTWDFLLSPPNKDEMESGSYESDTTLGPLSSVRSQSTESMPSLETDEESLYSPTSPGTPGLYHSSRNDRRLKSLSSSKGEDCLLDHPLLPPPIRNPDANDEQDVDVNPPGSSPATKLRFSFRSNLTASLQALRSAARSFSNFTALPVQRDDYLSRALLSNTPPFTDEPRPLPLEEPPDQALRRYLNPIALSAVELHYHTEQDRISCKSSIQLQSYQPGAHRSSTASSPPIFISRQQRDTVHFSKDSLDVEDALTSSSISRQREPRENSDFLRVIVLEMNMRKVGKLSESSPGRARLWLPARQVAKSGTLERQDDCANVKRASMDKEGGSSVPLRWTGIMA